MNKKRRKMIEGILEQLNDVRDAIEIVRDEESDYFDNMHENLQGGDKGQRAEECANQLSEALENVEMALSELEGAME